MILRFGKESNELPFQLFVFGSGSYETQIQYLAHKYQTIHYFGRQSRDTIRRYVSNCNFLLTPSTCLETFGLSALTGILRDLPAIGFAKGGNAPFIEPALDLTKAHGQTLGEKIYFLIHQLNKTDYFKATLPITDIIEKYKKENRKSNIAYLLNGKKKILIASDFTSKIGGIETYIHDAKEILEDM